MKHKLAVLFTGLILVFTIALLISIIRKVEILSLKESRIKTLPPFSFLTLSGTVFNSEEIERGPLVIIFFDPGCNHCRYEISELIKYGNKITLQKFLLISEAEKEELVKFYNDFQLEKQPGMTLLIDKNYSFRDIFRTKHVPSTFIYSRELSLIKSFKGEVKPETILECLTYND